MAEVETKSLTQELFELRVRLLHRIALRSISPNINESEVAALAKITNNDRVMLMLKSTHFIERTFHRFFGR
jgi:hypothetical protein